MCGIVGILATRPISLSDGEAAAMRDRMTHRGPDGAGLWRDGQAVLGHRRLIVIDTSEAGAQPMVSADGRHALVYNGELYNDAEIRAELMGLGERFSTVSDTETVLRALIRWGPAALGRLRGMYALGLYDGLERTLLLARDPMGIKPLYYRIGPTRDGATVVFASEPPAILAHPDIRAEPDLVAMSAYLTTIRTVMGERTLFDGIRTVSPGQAIVMEAKSEEIITRPAGTGRVASPPVADAAMVGACIRESVERHLRSDVPLCCLLSGGLDSSIVASVAMRKLGALNTYCSGAQDATGEDFRFAREVAESLNTRHTEAPVTREMFRERWPDMVRMQGTPLSTPNEVAINEVARSLRRDGNIVTLSGEGADELFAGYDIPMLDAARFEGLLPGDAIKDAAWTGAGCGGEFQLLANAWVSPRIKGALVQENVWRAVEQDHALTEFYRAEFEAAAAERDDDSPLQAHLRFQRRINLTGLLQRLDTATMLASVEGRTPFADRVVCELAEGLAIEEKFGFPTAGGGVQTKRALRSAFASELPAGVVARPKASFPLPIQEWAVDQAGVLLRSPFAAAVFTPAALQTVAANPGQAWAFAWPMINVAMWGDRWWG